MVPKARQSLGASFRCYTVVWGLLNISASSFSSLLPPALCLGAERGKYSSADLDCHSLKEIKTNRAMAFTAIKHQAVCDHLKDFFFF